MKKIILLIMVMSVTAFSQQIKSAWGYDTWGNARTGAAITYLDTATTTQEDFIFDIGDWYPFDIGPLVIDYDADFGTGADSTLDGTVKNNSDRLYIGTFYGAFDCAGTASPTTDSVLYTIAVYPGVYTTASKSISSVDWGTAVTLETVEQAGDYFSINNVYVHASKYKHFPPEVLKISITDINRDGADDSVKFGYRFRYPAIYSQQAYDKEGANE